MARMKMRFAFGVTAALLAALLVLGGCPNRLMESLEQMVSEASTTPHLTLKCLVTSTVIQDTDTYYCSALLGTPNPLEFELRNSGDRDLIVDSIEIVPGSGDVDDFDLTAGALPLAIAPGSTDSFEVTFDPAAIGVKQVEIRILHNGPEGGGELTFTLEGSAASTDATLSNLTVSEGTLTPSFSSGTLEYSVWVAHTVSTIQVTPTASSGDAAITVEGSPVASGASFGVDLIYGLNDINIVVTAGGGGGTLGYNIHVTRDDPPSTDASLSSLQVSDGTLSPGFAPGTYGYTCSVPYETNVLYITAQTNDAEATLQINKDPMTSGVPHSFSLSVGTNNICEIRVTAEAGNAQNYVITITRRAQATLKSLVVKAVYPEHTGTAALEPAFAATTYTYYSRVNAASEDLKITPTASNAGASITLNGSAISSGTERTFTAAVGRNDFTIVVTNGSGGTLDTRTYTLAVFVPLINLAVTGQTTRHVTGDDGDLECGLDWLDMTEDRFQQNTDLLPEVIIDDTFTNLEWVGTTASSMTWENALDYANTAVIAKLDDWRLPNVNELESLLNYSRASDTWLESLGFVNIIDSYYWTSTTYLSNTSYAYSVDMELGYCVTTRLKTQGGYVLLVRDMD